MGNTVIDRDEWLEELRKVIEASRPNDEGMKVEEWSALAGLSMRTMYGIVQHAMEKGLMVRGTRYEPNLLGRMVPKAVFRIVKKEQQ